MPRLSVNINDETAEALRALSDRRDVSITEIVRRAVSVYKFIDDRTQEGRRISTTDKSGKDVEFLAIL